MHILLPIIEEPSIFKNISYWVPVSIELVCLLIYLIRWIHGKWFQVNQEFNNDIKNYVVLATLIVIYFDIFCFIEPIISDLDLLAITRRYYSVCCDMISKSYLK